ncbi:MAG: glycosyltransferase [Gemmatimonadetes bacterium]|nr:glycosyltransferase [Gemmatimonadota bacterium]
MKQLLLIAYNFPPLTTSGMYRAYQFAKYLPRHGWRPLVVSVDPASLQHTGPLDAAPLASMNGQIVVSQARAFEPMASLARLRARLSGARRPSDASGDAADPGGAPGNDRGPGSGGASWKDWLTDWISLPDRQSGWIWPAYRAGMRLVREETVDAIVSTSPPPSGHLAALLLSRRTGLPWIADFRDPWIGNPYHNVRSSRFLDPADAWMERRVVRGARRVIANTEELRLRFVDRYPALASRFVTISNGFDGEEIMPRSSRASNEPFRIIHAGTLYGQRDPTPIVRALERMCDRGDLEPGEFELVLLGSAAGRSDTVASLLRSPLASRIRVEPQVGRAEALQQLADSDLLLLIQVGTTLQVPRKLFEYLAIGKPMLALVTEGATENLIRREKLGSAVRPDDGEGIENALRHAMTGQSRIPTRPASFDFRALTEQLVEELEEMIR